MPSHIPKENEKIEIAAYPRDSRSDGNVHSSSQVPCNFRRPPPRDCARPAASPAARARPVASPATCARPPRLAQGLPRPPRLPQGLSRPPRLARVLRDLRVSSAARARPAACSRKACRVPSDLRRPAASAAACAGDATCPAQVAGEEGHPRPALREAAVTSPAGGQAGTGGSGQRQGGGRTGGSAGAFLG